MLKTLTDTVPLGFFVDSRWLREHGISRQLTYRYVESGWLERVGYGLYRRPLGVGAVPDATSDWVIPLLSAQRIMGYDVHVGGPTALVLSGRSHYLPLGGKEVVYLYSDEMPRWLGRLQLRSELRPRTKRLFGDPDLGVEPADAAVGAGGIAARPRAWTLRASEPERAILESLDELPKHESFHNLDAVFEGLVDLRPRRLRALLESCRSVQVKRLFFVFADRHRHAWRAHLDPDGIDLGSGDRAFTQGGRLHPRYRITVPPEFLPRPEEEVADA